MNAWLIDAYRNRNSIVLWIKTPEEDQRIIRQFHTFLYIDAVPEAERFLKKNRISYLVMQKQTYLRKWKRVYAVQVPRLDESERFVKWIEKETRHRIPLYNADIAPEQLYLYEHSLIPCSAVEIDTGIVHISNEMIPLKKIEIRVVPAGRNAGIRFIEVNQHRLEGYEEDILRRFVSLFCSEDPDVVVMEYAFSMLPYLAERLESHKLYCPFHRWDTMPIRYKGGKSFFSYGRVSYRDFAIRLHGRFLVDSSTVIGNDCEVDAVIELCQLSGALFQQVASRSFGAVFQQALVRQMVQSGFLVPFKEKPIDKPLTMVEMLKSDRAGHTFDPKVGYHTNVAEIDFCSMYPWLIYNHNISADTILSDKEPFEHVPGVPVRTSLRHKGIVPITIKPILDRRMEYKRNPTAVNKLRAKGLKMVLVTCYGYLRFREFKMGIPSSHMAICAYAREMIIEAAHLAEERGFEVVHGIIDSLYIRKKDISEEEVRKFCKELEMVTGIPVSFEGIFKWVVFLPSVNDSQRPVPARYFGVFQNGTIKARGIEVRQSNVPLLVKAFQQKILESIRECTKKEIVEKAPILCKSLRELIKTLPSLESEWLCCSVRLSKTDYTHEIPQKVLVRVLRSKGVEVLPGQSIRYIFQQNKVVLPEDYSGKPDIEMYRKLLIRSLFVVLQPFGFTRDEIVEMSGCERQLKLTDFTMVKHCFVPIKGNPATRRGLAEKQLKHRLESQGWDVWRGGLISIVRKDDVYPNVRRRYESLHALLAKHHPDTVEQLEYLCEIHHGMPDFLCYRNGAFKFVECKLCHEQLSKRQKRCITFLKNLGFEVEVHKIVDEQTTAREAHVNIQNGQRIVVERQARISQIV